jgi:L-ribulose-5-phosphate 4-epimerase
VNINHDQFKSQILECAKWLSNNGFLGTKRGTAGNISIRLPGTDTIAVTPSNRSYETMSPADICIVDFELKKIDGQYVPSVETAMHVAVYKSRPDVGSVVHTHQYYASILSLMNKNIPALFDEVSSSIGHIVELIPYSLSGSQDLIANVVSKLGNSCCCYIMQNHGALCLGENLMTAWTNVELLEKVCRCYYHALAAGGEITTLPENITDLMRMLRLNACEESTMRLSKAKLES